MLASVAACALAVQLVQSPPPPPAAAGPQVLTGAVSTPTIRAPRSAALTSMYVSLAALQGLDVHSTMRALSSGAREANPAMREIVGNPAGLIAVKAATAAGGRVGAPEYPNPDLCPLLRIPASPGARVAPQGTSAGSAPGLRAGADPLSLAVGLDLALRGVGGRLNDSS